MFIKQIPFFVFSNLLCAVRWSDPATSKISFLVFWNLSSWVRNELMSWYDDNIIFRWLLFPSFLLTTAWGQFDKQGRIIHGQKHYQGLYTKYLNFCSIFLMYISFSNLSKVHFPKSWSCSFISILELLGALLLSCFTGVSRFLQ